MENVRDKGRIVSEAWGKRMSKKRILQHKTFVLVPSIIIILIAGHFEAGFLAKGAGVFKATHDDQCYVHFYLYTDNNTELRFGVSTERREEDRHLDLRSKNESNVVAAVQVDARHVSEFVGGRRYSINSRQCDLTIHPGENDPDLRSFRRKAAAHEMPKANDVATAAEKVNVLEMRLALLRSEVQSVENELARHREDLSQVQAQVAGLEPAQKTVEFTHCADLERGADPMFEASEIDAEDAKTIALVTLWFWGLLRVLAICREYKCLVYDSSNPPVVKDANSRMCGRNFILQNVVFVAWRPFALFSMLPAQLLRPWTTIKLHGDCPQLITQNVHPVLNVSALAIASCTIFCLVANYALDECYFYSNRDNPRDLGVAGRAHMFRFQDYVMNAFFLSVVAYTVASWILMWPRVFIVEWRGLFQISWPSFAVSNWSQVLRVLGFAIFVIDTLSFLGKLAAKPAQGIKLQHCSEAVKSDRNAVLAAVGGEGLQLEHAGELRNDREVVLEAVRQNGKALEHASEELKNDREVVLAAVRQKRTALGSWHASEVLKFASEELKNDPEVRAAAGLMQ